MWSDSLVSRVCVSIIAVCTSIALLNVVSFRSECSCVVHISGAAIDIRGCSFTPDFIEYAKTLRVFNHRYQE
nr:triple gene block protein 3 [Poplar mosaic virus]